MNDQTLVSIFEKLKNIKSMCQTRQMTLKEAQKDTLDVLNIIHNQYKDHIENEQMNKIYELISNFVFCSSIEKFIIELDEMNNILKRIIEEMVIKCQSIDWFEEVKKRVNNNNMFASELIVPDILNYGQRIEIFNKYIINEIKCKNDYDRKEIIERIRKLIIILFLPIHTKSTKINKTNIKISFYCNHSGKTKETCKGRNCSYKLFVIIGFDEKNTVVESGTHNHALDYSFVVSKTCPLLKQENS